MSNANVADMEELKLDEEDPKEISVEDILGTQSLLMSDSEEEKEVEVENPAAQAESKKKSPKRSKRITDSDDEEAKVESMSVDSDKEETDLVQKPMRKKIAAIVDSDSEEDESKSKVAEATKNKVSTLIDSESEEEDGQKELKDLEQKYAKLTKKNKSENKDAESEEESDSKLETEKPKKKISALVDSESEDSDDGSSEQQKVSDDEPGLSHSEELPNHEENNAKKKSKPMRASAQKALDEMQAIQSEQQRMHREAHLSIPYHKPKRHTLQEFLKRRTNVHSEGTSSPMPSKSLKMNSEELEAYAKLMEERAKEATEFFKSESEEECKDNESFLEQAPEPEPERSLHESESIETILQAEEQTLATEIDDCLEKTENMPLDNADQLDMVEDAPTISGVIITEVLELPKLDINTLCPNAVITFDAALTPNTKNSDNLKRLITEKVAELPESPSLHGDANMLIDLETGDLIAKQPTGVDNLLKRLMLSSKARKSKTSETMNILSTENGKLEISKVNISITDKHEGKEQKPGAAYFKLKENLKSIITNKRRADMLKKKEDEQEYRKCLDDDDDMEEDGDDEYDPETKPNTNDVIIDDEENAIDDEEDILEPDELDDNEEFGGEEHVNSEVNEDPAIDIVDEDMKDDNDDNILGSDENQEEEEEEEEEDDDDIALSDTCENGNRKNRIIKAFQDDSDDELDYLKPQFTATAPKSATTVLFETEVRGNHSDEENELLNLCSGQFGETQQPPVTPIISQIPATQLKADHEEVEEMGELCSGTFATQKEGENATEKLEQPSTTRKSHKILSSDEEEIDEKESTDKQNRKKLTKKMKTKKQKLGFSDDEDDTEDEKEIDLTSDAEDVQEEEAPETFIDYDSEENEVVVQMTKKDRATRAQKFFENEAVLSESEWGSADEDEKHMDKYDIELGDEDEFDREKIRAELGQIHARKMLDEDIREVRKIQEMLFEDEEKDGIGRQRQFKWKNTENGFNLDETNRGDMGEAGENAGGSGDEENEHLWRKIRFEREQLLQEQGLKENSQDMSSSSMAATTLNVTTLLASSSTNPATAGPAKKINIITAKKTLVTEKKSSPFLISKNSSAVHAKPVRGSFLVRGKEALTKLAAGLTKGNSNTTDGTAGTVSTKIIKPKNFVFATLTEEEHHENIKRKASDLMNSSSENGINYMKKPKFEPRRDKCLIDQLL